MNQSAQTSSPLMVSVSGVRGIVGESLTVDVVLAWARAFAQGKAPGPIVVGGDSRPSRVMVRSAVFAGLSSAGCRIVDLCIVPTPTISMAVRHHQARGGIAITASHNPAEWNALKFFGPDGLFLSDAEGKALQSLMQSGKFDSASAKEISIIEPDTNAAARHVDSICSIELLQIDKLKARNFRVALDTVHGAGGAMLLELLERLGCEVVPFHIEPTGLFPRNPEPTTENLIELGRDIAAMGVDIGFVVDPDADRLAVLLENGEPAGEELTLVAAADMVLRHQPSPVVANASTTRALDDVAARYGQTVLRTKVGEAHIAAKMMETGAVIGGEGNGGVMFAPVHAVRDSGVGIALILQALLESGETASQLFGSFPRYEFEKVRVEMPDLSEAHARLQALPGKINFGEPDRLDGLKWEFEDGWVQARPSNTEPIIRVFAEARTRKRARQLTEQIVRFLKLNSRE
ncbi:phosphoglucosamine mutase [bacterium]|nr:phosphoglucosamine mutase [bacterium]